MMPRLHPKYITISVLAAWLMYAFIYSFLKNQPYTSTLAGYVSLAGEMGLDMLAAFLSIHRWKNTTHPITKKIYITYFFSFIAAMFADSIYNIVLNLFGFEYNNTLIASLFEIPFVIFLLLQLTALSILLCANGKKKIKFTTISYLPYVLGSVLMFSMFMFGIPWKIEYSSPLGIFQTIDTLLEVIGFSVAIIILSRTKNNIIYFLVTGYLLIVSSDLVIRYSVISGQIPYLSSLEATWVLGLSLICLGLIFTISYKKKDLFHLSPINSLRSQITMWSLTLWMLSAFLLVAALFFTQHMEDSLNHIIKNLIFILIPFSLIATHFSRYISLKIAYPLMHIENKVDKFFKSDSTTIEKLKNLEDKSIFEFTKLEKFVFEAFTIYKQKNELKFEFAKKGEQLAHDIRSPLAAINTVLTDLTSIPEKKRIILRNAARRINDIANHFLSQNIAYKNPTIDNEKKLSSELLFVALENIISEKRYEYHNTQTNIQLDIAKHAYTACADINLPIFKRIISNLINNSIEACSSTCFISVYLNVNTHSAQITIQDNGCGIPSEIITKVTEQRFSFNKQQGAGLGLYYAKRYIEFLRGTLRIQSIVNSGTKVIMMLPTSRPPPWLCSSLQIEAGRPIVILDDDNAIHEAWENRLIPYTKNIHHFYKATDLASQFCKKMQNALYLIDYELLPSKKNGIDVIEDLSLEHQAVLVSSNFEDDAIRDRCISLGLKYIPKSYVPYIPFSVISDQQISPSLVLIDDDELIHMTWELAAKEHSKFIVTYTTLTDFINKLHCYQKNTPIYIDSDLGNNQKGEVHAEEIYKEGYKEIYLTTGYAAEKYIHIPWIKGVVGKVPPFLGEPI